MNNISYDLDKLIKIKVFDKTLNKYVTYLSEKKKTFWHKGRKEGFYGYSYYACEFTELLSDYEIDKYCEKYLLVDNKFYHKPKTILYFQDNYEYIYEFETYDEALNKAIEIKKLANKNWLEINV